MTSRRSSMADCLPMSSPISKLLPLAGGEICCHDDGMVTDAIVSMTSFRERIRILRLREYITQRQLAAQLRKDGWAIGDPMVSRYETGARTPTDPLAYLLAVENAVEKLVGK